MSTVVESFELRDRIAQNLHTAQCEGSTEVDPWDCGNPAHWQDWRELADITMGAVAPVLAARDQALVELERSRTEVERLEGNEEFTDRALHLVLGCCDPASDDDCPGRAEKVYEAMRRGDKVPYSWQGQSDAIVERTNEVLRERAERNRLQTQLDEAGTALKQIADQERWERTPDLVDRIEHVGFELKNARDELTREREIKAEVLDTTQLAIQSLRAELDALKTPPVALQDPVTYYEGGDEDDPRYPLVAWAINSSATVSIAYDEGGHSARVSVAGETQSKGIALRSVTADQIRSYANQLLAMVRDTEASGHGCPGHKPDVHCSRCIDSDPAYVDHLHHNGIQADCPYCPSPEDAEASEQAEPWKCGECKTINSPWMKSCEFCLSEAGPVVEVTPATPTEPRVWRDADDPNNAQPSNVYRVHDADGHVWEMKLGGDWACRSGRTPNVYAWFALMAQYGPLTEVVSGPLHTAVGDDWRDSACTVREECCGLRKQLDISQAAVRALVKFRQDLYEALGVDQGVSPGRHDGEVLDKVSALVDAAREAAAP